jgi:hypothetical protein
MMQTFSRLPLKRILFTWEVNGEVRGDYEMDVTPCSTDVSEEPDASSLPWKW